MTAVYVCYLYHELEGRFGMPRAVYSDIKQAKDWTEKENKIIENRQQGRLLGWKAVFHTFEVQEKIEAF